MCRLKVKELVAKAHTTVGELPPAQRQVMTEVITRLDTAFAALTESIELRAAVVAENAGLKNFISTDCFVAHVETETFYEEEVTRYVNADGYEPETPATDAYLAEVRAQAVDEIAELYFTLAAHEANRSIADSWRESARFARDHAAQLRQGEKS